MTSPLKLFQLLVSTSKSLKPCFPERSQCEHLRIQAGLFILLRGPVSTKRCYSTFRNWSRSADRSIKHHSSNYSTSQITELVCGPGNYQSSADQTSLKEEQVKGKFGRESWHDIFNETNYYFEDGLRKVYPYYFKYSSFVKGSWIGKSVQELYQTHFERFLSHLQMDIDGGQVKVNGLHTTSDYKLRACDKIEHLVHRHELPVLDRDIIILHCDSEIVVVNKPASIPVHPNGKFRHNTIMIILAKEYGFRDLLPIHRLDKPCSGLLLFPRTQAVASKMAQQIMSRSVEKLYVCRVMGEFPNGIIECNNPLQMFCLRNRYVKVDSAGKQSSTTFEKIAFNSRTNRSILLCRPHTGRPHQIRVHLQSLGFPIENDPIYSHPCFVSCQNEDSESSESSIIDILGKSRSGWKALDEMDIEANDFVYPPWNNLQEESKGRVDSDCQTCKLPLIVKGKTLEMCLHALSYSGNDWKFSSPMPLWADPEWEFPISDAVRHF